MLVCYEYIANLDDEVQYIWRWPMNRVKIIYFVARYLGLVGLITNVVLLFAGPLSTTPVHVAYCRGWFTMLTITSCFVLFAMDAIAMLRVYALYNRNVRVGAFFSSVLLTEATLVTTCSSRTIGIVPFSPICDVEETPFQVIYFTCGVIFAQCSLLFFTFRKRKEMASQRHVPVIKLVFREGTWMSTLICCVFLFIVPYSLITGTAKPHIVFVWPITFHSIAACRVILNMHRLPSPGLSSTRRTGATSQQTDTDIQFTSFFNLSQQSSTASNTEYSSGSVHFASSGSQQEDEDRSSKSGSRLSSLSSLPVAFPSAQSISELPSSGILPKPEEVHSHS